MKRVLLVGIVFLLGGCGVPTEREPRAIEPSVVLGSYEGPPRGSPGAVVERLFMVRGGKLVAVDRRVGAVPSPKGQLDDLVAGPTPQEREAGLGSALSGTDFITGVDVRGGTTVVAVAGDNPIRNDEILAYGQVVCTLSARSDVASVQFAQDGQVLEVPRADGSLSSAPLMQADYAALIG